MRLKRGFLIFSIQFFFGGWVFASPLCSWLFEVQYVRLQHIQSWKEFSSLPMNGITYDFSRDHQYLTSFQQLKPIQGLPLEDQGIALKILKKSMEAKFVRGAIVNAQIGEFGSFSELVNRELYYLKNEDPNSHEMQARLLVFARYHFSDFILKAYLFSQGYRMDDVEKIRLQYRLKPKPAPVIKLGSEQVLYGVEIGFLRLRLANGQKWSFMNSSSHFTSVHDLEPILDKLKNESKFTWDQVVSIDFFHNHPGSELSPLSASDARAKKSLEGRVLTLAKRPISIKVHAIQEVNQQVIVFSSREP